MKSRIPFLALSLFIGLAIGLIYGWIIRPVEYINSSPGFLRADYRSDYVLMVAESYYGHEDLIFADQQLAALGPDDTIIYVQEALSYARHNDAPSEDLAQLENLEEDLRLSENEAELGGAGGS